MSKELNLQSVFNDSLNYIHRIVGKYVKDMQPILSKMESRDCWRLSIRASCKTCGKPVIATIANTEENWSRKLVDVFIMRVEYHQSKHSVIQATRLPKRIRGH